jgi:crotonobetainyl-CoA:carnitine CoA-transferase CaiB-like acyl-CoA transferase
LQRLRFTGTGFRLAHGNGELTRMAPSLEQDTVAILESLGYSPEEVSNLRRTQVV